MSEAKITLDEVRHAAGLSRLALSTTEEVEMQRSLDAILGYMEELANLDLEGVAPTYHPVPMSTRLRPDTLQASLPHAEALAAAPSPEADGFAVPRVLEGES